MRDHINVCICTYKRINLLDRLLEKLRNQITDSTFTYDIIIVDNDFLCSAKDVVGRVRNKGNLDIKYFFEPIQNIALARNKTVENATGTLIVFLDDDEFPYERWLLDLYLVYRSHVCDGVLGPVFPYFEREPPSWVKKGRFFEKKILKKVKYLKWEEMYTSNVLVSRSSLLRLNQKFDERLGRTGGEDSAFFKNMINNGCSFVWANDVYVYEMIPQERWSMKWLLKRSLRTGGTFSKLKFDELNFLGKVFYTCKFFVGVLVFLIYLPFSVIFGKHVFVKYMMKLFSNIGKIGGVFNFILIEYEE